jgi:hypothetical protein
MRVYGHLMPLDVGDASILPKGIHVRVRIVLGAVAGIISAGSIIAAAFAGQSTQPLPDLAIDASAWRVISSSSKRNCPGDI